MMRFRYQAEALLPPAPPTLPPGSRFRFRPYLRIQAIGPSARLRDFQRVLADTGATETVFPGTLATTLRVQLSPPTVHLLRWRGNDFPIRYGKMDLQISADGQRCRWTTTVSFSSAPLPYPLAGVAGFLEFFDASFLGADNVLELDPNRNFPGSITAIP